MNWGSFGEITFKTGFTPKSVKRSNAYRQKAHETFNEYPLVDFLGESLETLELNIELSYIFTDVVKTIEKLKEYARKGEAKSLVIGKLYTGRWIIERIERVYEETDTQGNLLFVNLTLKFVKVKLTNDAER